jgi:hypothetical protein
VNGFRRSCFALGAALAALAGAWSACREQPPAETRLLVLDGMEFQLADVDAYVAFLDSFLPEAGRKTKIQRVLDELLIPRALARRAFATEREQLRQRALELCKVATNVNELDQQTKQVSERRRAEVTRAHLPLPVAMYAFDPLLVGSVSEPIEVPQGFIVAGVFDLREASQMALADYVDVLQIAFVHHRAADWKQWYQAEQARLADKATFVHPDHVHSIPQWIRPVKNP